MGGVSMGELLIIAFIIVMLFGTKKLAHLGGDLGVAIRDFKRALHDENTHVSEKKDASSIKNAE
ncbi:twin-arginine translocase TatA/TatE family subunit [Enterovibrio sp. ZSDZ35]|uniref:Sec-independent protein translocase protein TatA n=1 Tax=Enterovibrio qingdaonensis TaxID=2899818 RepID=A0ABT5QGQ8_9GAMM|nr:twin-arginine translocase TatA/TatE family subunit [Enterovibrio sp. ZSDZ35]MDD1780155.1 twin-arginine translocase TatA/TatE family subunit [Enterovibrio sp. ZSDZ35]